MIQLEGSSWIILIRSYYNKLTKAANIDALNYWVGHWVGHLIIIPLPPSLPQPLPFCLPYLVLCHTPITLQRQTWHTVDFIQKRRLCKDDHLRHQICPLSQTCQTGSKTFPPVDVWLRLGFILGWKMHVVSSPVGLRVVLILPRPEAYPHGSLLPSCE